MGNSPVTLFPFMMRSSDTHGSQPSIQCIGSTLNPPLVTPQTPLGEYDIEKHIHLSSTDKKTKRTEYTLSKTAFCTLDGKCRNNMCQFASYKDLQYTEYPLDCIFYEFHKLCFENDFKDKIVEKVTILSKYNQDGSLKEKLSKDSVYMDNKWNDTAEIYYNDTATRKRIPVDHYIDFKNDVFGQKNKE